ncbi:hypothetical protein R1flu_010262 [Riccia fluitans]|uniref:DDE Tnp4 domain-containing protein n=1 Tax=Riccia fluitans TaxID=41844 RepID=A0ABD1Z4I0_9MARC
MDARRASFERLDYQLERQDKLNLGFIPCNSPTNDATLVYHWSQIPNSQLQFPSMERPIPLHHPYLQSSFAANLGDSFHSIRTSMQVHPTQPAAVQRVSVAGPSSAIEDALDGVGAQRSRSKTSTVFNWDHQAVLFLIDSKRQEWEEFESTSAHQGIMVIAIEKWRKMHKRHSVYTGGVSKKSHSMVDGDIHTPTDSVNRTPEQNDQDNEEEALVEQPPIVPPSGCLLPPDATRVSNLGKRKKFVAKQDAIVDAIADFSTQLVDVERSRQACESEQLCPPDSSILIGVLCAIQTVLEYYEEEEEMLSEGPGKQLKTSGIYLLATPALSRCFPAIVAQFLLLPSAIASGIMREGVEAIIAELGPEYLKWPSTSEMIKVSNGFQLRSGLPNVQGAVDGTFIRIRAPPTGITSDVSWASKIVHACCVLHNLLVKHCIAASRHILDEVEAQLDRSVAGTTGHRPGDSSEEVEPAPDGYNVGSTPTLAEKLELTSSSWSKDETLPVPNLHVSAFLFTSA